jgi:drug/metabolite transporter (DMT)-like permease
MDKNIQNYLWLIFSAFFGALTIVIVQYYQHVKKHWLLVVALLSEAILIYGYTHILQYSDILTQFSLVKIISIAMIAFASLFIFKNGLSNRKAMGLFFAMAAIYLLR